MTKNRLIKIITLVSIFAFVFASATFSPASALLSQNETHWYWTSDTNSVSQAIGDVNGDGQNEVVTGGYFNDGNRFNAQIIVWNPNTLSAISETHWYWTGETQLASLTLANITGGVGLDIISVGSYFDGTRWNSQLIVWNGTTLAAERFTHWFQTGNTEVSSVAVANITGGTSLDIVTGGAYFDGTRWNAQLIIWNGATLAAEKMTNWYWTSNTYINSLTVANMTGGSALSIITGATFFDGTRNNAQLITWDAASLTVTSWTFWYWTGNTEITSLATANITGSSSLDIVTGGDYSDNTRLNAQLIIWNGATMAATRLTHWYWTSNTKINAIAIYNLTGGPNLDIITAGYYNDGIRSYAQVIDWDSSNLAAKTWGNWYTTSNTVVNAVGVTPLSIAGNRIFAVGSYYDLTRSVAELSIWG
jgi:hypothetical protein